MRLHKLTLRHWRGITHREIHFDDGVTLLEGPNEIGKSSIIEAIQLLFSELDSSNKKQVKSVQPAGQDVGSEVSVEFSVAGHRVIYAKTYNKNRSTTAHISGTKNLQETGRSAHEWVANLLSEQVDMDLWQTLLVDQGEQINQIKLSSSVSLAQALDSVAGATDTSSHEDETLISAAQREYERYYTLKTGRIKYTELVNTTEQVKARLAELTGSMHQLEQDQQQQKTIAQEVERLRIALPQMRQAEQAESERWQKLQEKTAALTTKKQSLAEIDNQLSRTLDTIQSRAALVTQIQEQQKASEQFSQEIETLQQHLQQESKTLDTLNSGLARLQDEEKELRGLEKLTGADLNYLEKEIQLTQHRKTLSQIESIEQELTENLAAISDIPVDAQALATYVQLEQALAVAQARAEVASTNLTFTAKKPLPLIIDDQTTNLSAGQEHKLSTSRTLHIKLPDLLDIEVSPPESTTDLAQQHQQAKSQLQALQTELGVSDLQSATALARQRSDREAEVQQLKSQQRKILQDLHISELEQQIKLLTKTCTQYIRDRAETPSMPADTRAAAENLLHIEHKLARLQTQIEQATKDYKTQAAAAASARQTMESKTAQNLAAKAATDALRQSLEEQRQKRTDASLTDLKQEQQTIAADLRLELDAISAELAQQNVEAQKMLLENAAASADRTAAELRQQEQALAILNDRLEIARANGLHESIAKTQTQLLQLQQDLTATQRRAEAAQKLWVTLNHHRDAARQAYLQPLKQHIEALGKLVFGPTFEIEIAQDWSITHRTLGGITLAFDDLSIGAKEQLAILMRLAAAQLVARHSGIPLFIDDALGFSDPQKLNTMGAAIAAAGRTCQIIILTCAPGRYANVGNAHLIRLTP
jgi:DNA repair exonuclease SbcCD ATPase subunit